MVRGFRPRAAFLPAFSRVRAGGTRGARSMARAPRCRVEPTEDGRFVVIDGRKWRATDPSIAERDAAVLRRWLARARRDVGGAKRKKDAEAERDARARVQAAKTALGERGTPWWEQSDEERRQRCKDGLARAAEQGYVHED